MSDTTATAPKGELSKSESWVTIVAILGAIAPLVGSGISKWVTLAATVIAAGSYAYFHTSLPSQSPGWKTPAFWGALATVGGSVALALTQTDISFLPVGVTKVAALIVAAVTAAGYTLYRYNVKQAQAIAQAPAAGPPPITPPSSETPTPTSNPKKAA